MHIHNWTDLNHLFYLYLTMTNTSLFMKAIIDLFIMRKPSGIIQIDVNQLIRNILNLGITKQE